MFESLSDRFEGIFRRLKGRGRLGEAEVDEVLREIRVALLEADVNFKVVKALVARIRERCVGADLSGSLTPAQQVIKIVHEELIASLGGGALKITYASKPPTVVMLAGLQGSGQDDRHGQAGPLVQAAGPQPAAGGGRPPAPGRRRAAAGARPPGRRAGVQRGRPTPSRVATAGLAEAQRIGRDVLIVDTAGRLHVDEELMDEARRHLRRGRSPTTPSSSSTP